MMIVDSQIHLWSSGKPNGAHRQIPVFSAEDAIAEMEAAGVDAALVHPPGWDPNAGAVAVEAARRYPDRFAVLGPLPARQAREPRVDRRLEEAAGNARPALHLPRAAHEVVDDRRHHGLAVAGGRARRIAGGSCGGRSSRRGGEGGGAPSGPQAHHRPSGRGLGREGRGRLRQAAGAGGARAGSPTSRSRPRPRPARRARPIPTATSTAICARSSMRSVRAASSGAPT